MTQRSRAIVAGVALIVLGLSLYYLRTIDTGKWYIMFTVLGGALVAGYFYARKYPLLVMGCITLGLSIGSVGDRSFFRPDRGDLLPLGAAFLGIYAIQMAYERKAQWWPLIPGVVLIGIAFDFLDEWMSFLQRNWPLVLIVIGVVVILGAVIRGQGDGGSKKTPAFSRDRPTAPAPPRRAPARR